MAIPLVLLVGMSKGGFGGGLGMLAVPLLSLIIDPRLAAAILLPILCVMDGFSLWNFRGLWHKQNIKYLLPGALVGIIAGAIMFRLTNADMIRLMVGVLSLYFVAHYLWGRAYLAHKKQSQPQLLNGSLWGTIAGYTSFIAHAGGPPVAIYLLPQRMDKSLFAGTTVVFFALVNFIKLIPYGFLGQLDFSSLQASLILLPLAPLGVAIGFYLHKKISDRFFYQITYVFLLFAGIKLTYSGIVGIWG